MSIVERELDIMRDIMRTLERRAETLRDAVASAVKHSVNGLYKAGILGAELMITMRHLKRVRAIVRAAESVVNKIRGSPIEPILELFDSPCFRATYRPYARLREDEVVVFARGATFFMRESEVCLVMRGDVKCFKYDDNGILDHVVRSVEVHEREGRRAIMVTIGEYAALVMRDLAENTTSCVMLDELDVRHFAKAFLKFGTTAGCKDERDVRKFIATLIRVVSRTRHSDIIGALADAMLM